jgi:glycosyltransferase involved in cell wall biosynthesis
MTKISIAMTTYNGEQWLPEQLASFAAQERLPDELVVCDDRSKDRTVEILQEFAASAPFKVRVVLNEENLGHERNFGKAIDLCTGDLIFLADQDDAWNPDKFRRVEAEMAATPEALLLVNDVMITDGRLKPLGRTVVGQMRAAGVLGEGAKSLTLGCATAFRAKLRRFISPVPTLDYGHDSWIHDFTDLLGGRRALFEVLQLYRRHDSNVSTWAFNSSEKASRAVVMQPSAGKDLTGAYDNRLRALRLMLERVESVAAVERRKAIFRRGWLGKRVTALGLWLRGDYRYFLGWRSLAKDLIR